MKMSLAENIREIQISQEIDNARIGKITKIDENGHILIDFPGNTKGPLKAQFTNSIKLQISNQDDVVDQNVLLIFDNNNPELPIIIDTIHLTVDKTLEHPPMALEMGKPEDVKVDGNRVVFDAKKEIILRCGKASITLTRAGKVLIRGAYLLNRSTGVNKIKGGSVQIN